MVFLVMILYLVVDKCSSTVPLGLIIDMGVSFVAGVRYGLSSCDVVAKVAL